MRKFIQYTQWEVTSGFKRDGLNLDSRPLLSGVNVPLDAAVAFLAY